jgi:YD repeat-containing protein
VASRAQRRITDFNEDPTFSPVPLSLIFPLFSAFDTSTSNPNRIIEYTYVATGDGKGNVKDVIINPHLTTSLTVTYTYDALGRVTKVNRPDGEDVLFDLSKMGDLEKLSIPTDTTAVIDHSFTYDETHTVDTYVTPENVGAGAGGVDLVYDTDLYDNGALKQSSTPAGLTTVYEHDAGASGTIGYDSSTATFIAGQLDVVDLPGTEGEIVYTYTTENKPSKIELDRDEDGTAEETVEFTYDGNVPLSVTYKGTLGGTTGVVVSSVLNDGDLSLASTTYAGVTDSFAYDDDGLLEEVSNTGATWTLDRLNGVYEVWGV